MLKQQIKFVLNSNLRNDVDALAEITLDGV